MNDRDFRLAKTIRPSRYRIHIDADLDAWQFRGTEEIDVRLDEPVGAVTLHAVDLQVSDATAVLPDGSRHKANLIFNPEAETVTLRFGQALSAGTATLAIQFGGAIRAALRGFYRSEKDGARYAATQFEAADARRAFPCFDEPEFKARFALTLTVPSEAVAISNGAIAEERDLGGGRKQVRFNETPPISSYLVAYTIGPYEPTPVARTKSGVPVRVFLPDGMAEKGLYARDAHVRSLEYLEDYTAIPHPYEKVDAIGVPDFEAGAMENPGAITYRLTAIAADPERASTHALKGIFYTAAHELTHMWWGDLVTMAWWDDLWLNESFATFIGYKVVADLVPEWGLWRDFVATLTRPFNLDALVSTHPISFEVRNAKQATERFDVITYWKGAGVVRMIEGFLGADAFRRGVRTYLNRYRESNATADDFWRELSQASGREVGPIADAWIKRPGHPIVHLTAKPRGGGLEISARQERFYADPNAEREKNAPAWPIPMVIKYGTPAGVEEMPVLLADAQATVTLPNARWFFPNSGGTGFYRFALDDTSLSNLSRVLQSQLSAQERLMLIGNQWALAKAGEASLAQLFTVLDGFREESDRAVLSAITERLAWLDTHLLEESARPAFERWIAGFYQQQFETLGWDTRKDESVDDRLRRATVIGALGDLGASKAVRSEARQRLERYLDDRTTLDPNLVSVAVDLSARGGGDDLYRRYLECKHAATKDPEDEQRFLFGLTAFEQPALIRRTLDLALTDEVRPQDRAHLLARLLGQRTSRRAAWELVRSRWQELVAQMDPMLQQNLVRGLSQLSPEPMASEVRDFLPQHVTDETRETVAQALEQLAIDAAACVRLAPELTAVLRRST